MIRLCRTSRDHFQQQSRPLQTGSYIHRVHFCFTAVASPRAEHCRTAAAAMAAINPSSVIRAIWFGIGTGAAYGSYYMIHKDLWTGARQVAEAHGTLPTRSEQQQSAEPLLGPAVRESLAARWNQLVDNSIGRLAQDLGRRGW